MTAWRGFYGLGELLANGSRIRIGFRLLDLYGGIADRSGVPDDIEGCLYQTGAFNSVTVQLSESAALDYLLIQGEVATDFAAVEDVASLIAGQVAQCLPSGMSITSSDALAIDFRPTGRTDAAAPRDTHGGLICPPGTRAQSVWGGLSTQCVKIGGQPDGAPSQCDWSKLSIGDYLACQLGVTPTTAILIGILGGVVALRVIQKGL